MAERSLRRDALERLGALSAASPYADARRDFAKLCNRCPGPRPIIAPSEIGSSAMGLPELEALLALCKAAPLVSNFEIAAQLLAQLTTYLPESHAQHLDVSLSLLQGRSSPWEALTNNLASAILALGTRHASLHQHASSTIVRYLANWRRLAHSSLDADIGSVDHDQSFVPVVTHIVTLAVSLLGFMEAAAANIAFWTCNERLRLVHNLSEALSDKFMMALETSLSVIRNSRILQADLRVWKFYMRRYAADGRPLGAMLLRVAFTNVMACSATFLIATNIPSHPYGIFDLMLNMQHNNNASSITALTVAEKLTDMANRELHLLDEGFDYLRLGSAWQQSLAFTVRSNVFKTFVCCSISEPDTADRDGLFLQLEAVIADPSQIIDEHLARVVFQGITVLAKHTPSLAPQIGRCLERTIISGALESKTAAIAVQCLATVLAILPQDSTITTLYSLGNVLSKTSTYPDRKFSVSPVADGSGVRHLRNGMYETDKSYSVVSLISPEEPTHLYFTTIQAIVRIATTCRQDKIIALALSMLTQKTSRISLEVDAKIITETAVLGAYCAASELRSLLKHYAKICHDALIQNNVVLLDAVMQARLYLSRNVKRGSEAFQIYIIHLLDSIVSKGDAHENDNKQYGDVELAAREIGQLLRPLAALAAANAFIEGGDDSGTDEFITLQRDAWFNSVVHGFTLKSAYGQRHQKELQILAQYSRPLIAEDRADHLESDIELNTTLRRGKSHENATELRNQLLEALPDCQSDLRELNYPELVFLTSALMVENLRAMSGDCSRVLTYFLDPRLRSGALGNCMVRVAASTVKTYLERTLSDKDYNFSSPYVAQQLALFFAGCCHRIGKVQLVAFQCADLIVSQIPSSLCHKSSLFALFELLNIMWTSCLEHDTDEYQWRSKFRSEKVPVVVELSDDYYFRRRSLVEFHARARLWIMKVLDIAPLDIKGLIQTYLSDYDDERSFGHVSLGRSFALEMGGVIPATDQRLGAVDAEPSLNINVASDFVAQYTTRQEYRFADVLNRRDHSSLPIKDDNSPSASLQSSLKDSLADAHALLIGIEARSQKLASGELRDVLRRTGALLCRSSFDQGAIVHHLVGIPFAVLSRSAIKLGISLWTGVIKENSRMESRILAEIARCWENSVLHGRGLFDSSLSQADPFFERMEFAPSSRTLMSQKQQTVYDRIAPHLRLTQFLSSHFNASLLGTPHLQRLYIRLMYITLDALSRRTFHPLCREVYFHIILLATKILRFSSSFDSHLLWRLKDRILTAALAWFASLPKWSYGGNRLQIKAETHLLVDLQSLLDQVSHIGSDQYGPRKSLHAKQELLSLLLANEQRRLLVWLYPLDYAKKHYFILHHHDKSPSDSMILEALKVAWTENPRIAMRLCGRFKSRPTSDNLRFLLHSFPSKVLDDSYAAELLLGSELLVDSSFQLEYLLYWAFVNPITAVNFFLPSYCGNPFLIQYAMRSLESHSVDTTFFYVPQIVQTLRYDFSGYVQRYIIETAKFSQLFAHQIIWNMKANAYKDEDSQVPDSVKPILDKVLESLLESFSPADKDFYDREFSFFNRVTNISGKLKPLIKKSKPEKKQKIEEELRQIPVEYGVYLPSNPNGVVIGIDRKSGKPLQSHAKAPFMATFRIRKEREQALDENSSPGFDNGLTSIAIPDTYETWQSAIFKVGDDCRQDVLALQLIAAFRGIFHSVGLDVYVNPYRVTATAPGCGVIDVLPNSISRDMLGREAVNGLYDYFISKYGGEDSIAFQEARNNFVKSMAAYSVISWILQFKDRHNGNIMIDDAGHILHIDFGFCFDIVPGGVKFERAPFKLTQEMVSVMGGPQAQAYKWFEELCIKAFLASRPHAEHLGHIVKVMMDSGLPCFKPSTLSNMRDRFVPDKNEQEAADFMRDLIRRSFNSLATKGYDQFQLWTNGIPY